MSFSSDDAPLSKTSLLLVDDSDYARFLARRSLEPLMPKAIHEARTGLQALALYRDHRPDLVLIDIVMEEMNGLITLKAIMSLDPGARTIMVSAVDVPEILNDCINQGILDFVVKPYTDEELRQAVLNAVLP